MCIMCVEINKGRMTSREVGSALKEFMIPDNHEQELAEVLKNNFDIKEIRDIFTELDEAE